MLGAMSASAMIGRVLHNTYRLERLIGEGGMGSVFEASHLRLARRFAIKVLAPHVASDSEAFARFKREAEITSALGHPNIVEVIDFNAAEDGSYYIVMERLVGEDLGTRISRLGMLDLGHVATIFRQCASALEQAHRKGVVHRDLKPENIFLCQRDQRDDYVKLVDFGISKVLGSQSLVTKTHVLMGTPAYMAPEQARGQPGEVGPRTDIYAMGVLLYEMLSGHQPFVAESVPSLLYKIVHEEPTPLDRARQEITPDLAATVGQALAKEPRDRYPSMKAFWLAYAAAIDPFALEVAPHTDEWPLESGLIIAPDLPSPASHTVMQYGALPSAAASKLPEPVVLSGQMTVPPEDPGEVDTLRPRGQFLFHFRRYAARGTTMARDGLQTVLGKLRRSPSGLHRLLEAAGDLAAAGADGVTRSRRAIGERWRATSRTIQLGTLGGAGLLATLLLARTLSGGETPLPASPAAGPILALADAADAGRVVVDDETGVGQDIIVDARDTIVDARDTAGADRLPEPGKVLPPEPAPATDEKRASRAGRRKKRAVKPKRDVVGHPNSEVSPTTTVAVPAVPAPGVQKQQVRILCRECRDSDVPVVKIDGKATGKPPGGMFFLAPGKHRVMIVDKRGLVIRSERTLEVVLGKPQILQL